MHLLRATDSRHINIQRQRRVTEGWGRTSKALGEFTREGNLIYWWYSVQATQKVLFQLDLKEEYSRAGLPQWLSSKRIGLQYRRLEFNPWVWKILCRRKWQPTSVFMLEESHGQRSLVGCSLWGHTWLSTCTHTHTHTHTQDRAGFSSLSFS